MNVLINDQKSVTLIPYILTMNQTLDMTLYSITKFELTYFTNVKGGIKMTIRMKRKILSEMMTTYFPSLLLMMITYATTFFKPFFFEAALSVNLTTMLVMTTIFISKMEGLPPTSDIKMIDCWLILCQLVPFAQVVLLTAIEYLREAEENEKQELNSQNKETQKNMMTNTLQFDLKRANGIEEDEPQEAQSLEKQTRTKSALVTKSMAVGEH